MGLLASLHDVTVVARWDDGALGLTGWGLLILGVLAAWSAKS